MSRWAESKRAESKQAINYKLRKYQYKMQVNNRNRGCDWKGEAI